MLKSFRPQLTAALLFSAVLISTDWCCLLSARGEEYGAVHTPALQASRVANAPAPLPSGAVPTRSHYASGNGNSGGGNTAVAIPAAENPAGNYAAAYQQGHPAEPVAHQTAAYQAPAQLMPLPGQAMPIAPRGSRTTRDLQRSPAAGWGAVSNVAASLGIVLAAFLCVAWLSKRYLPKAVGPLPKEVVEPLGWAPLAGRQQMQLVRLGNKLVLLAITPGSGAEALSEVTEPSEVERLSAMCRRTSKNSSTQAFREVINELERQPARGFVENEIRPVRTAAGPAPTNQVVARPQQPGRPMHG
ncbi:FliO/MopB family protein [Anatilimnocola sp. NA78]|uniref:FliO/MopB family protein n=1 Tax=Anatilimnocola sp. NA78 TaxID=3415683 RepID=UPI003CE4B077